MAVASRAVLRARKKKAFSCIQANRFDEARTILSGICKANPRDAETHFLFGVVNGQLGLLDDAIEHCATAVKLKPDYVDAWYNLAQAYMHSDRPQDAVAAYKKVTDLKSDYVEAHFNLGFALEQLGDYASAIKSYRKAVSIKPDYAEAYCNLGNLINNINQGSKLEGLSYLKLAVRINPAYLKGRLYLGRALSQNGGIEEALEQYDKILEQEPRHIEALCAKALAYEKKGDFQNAAALLEPLLDQVDIHVAGAFAAVAVHIDRSEEAIQSMEAVLDKGGINSSDARSLHFRLGKLLDRAGEYERAFNHFSQANKLKPFEYDVDAALSSFDDIRNFFTPSRMADLPRSAELSVTPIFIVGMPRSGTTLIEQILDSHPQVYGAGELVFVEDSASAIGARSGRNRGYPDCMDGVSSKVIEEISARHLKKLQEFAPDALRIVDKMPHNFRYLGLIELLFPGARVIHCMRHPCDTCLSIYSYDFNAMHAYSTDLGWLGQYYLKYQELMEYWKSVLQIPILDVKYEELVSDQETMTRRLIEFCGLDWDEQCLAFHKNKRSVNTISYDQVRQPIYAKSVARWRHYEQQLEPLRRVLNLFD